MKLFSCVDHDAFWPVGVASVVVAPSKRRARVLLDRALIERGLRPGKEYPYTLDEISLEREDAYILDDGDY